MLADKIWPHYIYGKNALYSGAHHGNALLSKYAFTTWENINVAFSKRASRSLLHGVVHVPDKQINLHVICIHLGLFKIERSAQLTTLSKRISSHVPEDEPLIIAGDFNDWRGHAKNFLGADLGLSEVFKQLFGDNAKTFPAVRPTFKVDRIYFRGLKLNKGLVLWQDPWKNLSDHIPLYAEFGWL